MTVDEPLPADQIVRTALQLLPVPEHGQRFWAELDARLAAEPLREAVAPTPVSDERRRQMKAAGSVVAEPSPDPTLALVPPALRRRSNAVLSAVAVAAAVMVVVAGTTLVRQRADDGVGVSESAEGGPSGKGALVSTSTSEAAVSGADADNAEVAALAWIAAVGRGDTNAAWATLGPASKAHFGGRSAFAVEQAAMVEAYGAWAGVTQAKVFVTPLAASGDGQVVVVTLLASVGQAEDRRERAVALPVRIVGDESVLEPFAFAGELEMVVPALTPADGTRPVVGVDEDLVVVVPRGVQAPTLRIDGGRPMVCGEAEGTKLVELDGVPGQRCSYHRDGGLRPGKRLLTVAFLSADGTGITASAVLFEAA